MVKLRFSEGAPNVGRAVITVCRGGWCQSAGRGQEEGGLASGPPPSRRTSRGLQQPVGRGEVLVRGSVKDVAQDVDDFLGGLFHRLGDAAEPHRGGHRRVNRSRSRPAEFPAPRPGTVRTRPERASHLRRPRRSHLAQGAAVRPRPPAGYRRGRRRTGNPSPPGQHFRRGWMPSRNAGHRQRLSLPASRGIRSAGGPGPAK